MDSLKVLDPEGPIREADVERLPHHVRKVPEAEIVLLRKQTMSLSQK
jgi:hypothetical protein